MEEVRETLDDDLDGIPAFLMEVVANCDHLVKLKFSKAMPLVFTEHGTIMAASVLNSSWTRRHRPRPVGSDFTGTEPSD